MIEVHHEEVGYTVPTYKNQIRRKTKQANAERKKDNGRVPPTFPGGEGQRRDGQNERELRNQHIKST
jgi:hypothetical protein